MVGRFLTNVELTQLGKVFYFNGTRTHAFLPRVDYHPSYEATSNGVRVFQWLLAQIAQTRHPPYWQSRAFHNWISSTVAKVVDVWAVKYCCQVGLAQSRTPFLERNGRIGLVL